ncbi:hypothetical protein KKA09_01340, partial [Patescibacteria group bacterium]|nr:hypothetical protein [Patescibacteria group bacterium]
FLIFIFSVPLFSSFIVLLFQIPTAILCKRILKKAKRKRERFKNLLVIGITGSYGKTSSKEFLATILSEKFNVLKTEKHINAEIGIAQTILNNLNENHQVFICEIGAYEKGKVKEVCEIIKPKIGIVTGVNEQHLAIFGSMKNLLSAEGGEELIDSLPADGMAFFNAKNKYCLELYKKTDIKKFIYGENVKLQGLENIEGAKMVARELGMSEKEIEKACQEIENKFPGIQIKKGIDGLNIIDAVYSANPDGVVAHLEYLKTWSGRKIIVMPCLIELGKASKQVHQIIGKKIAENCALAIIITKDKFREIRDSAISNGMKKENILFIESPKKIFEKIKEFCYSGDVILLEGRMPGQLLSFLAS